MGSGNAAFASFLIDEKRWLASLSARRVRDFETLTLNGLTHVFRKRSSDPS
jgi:hypothetical protein